MEKPLIDFIDSMMGIPYELNGRDPEVGLDCMGVILHFYRGYLKTKLFDDTEIVPKGWEDNPEYAEYMEKLLHEHGILVKEPAPFDIVLVASTPEHFFANHVGVYLPDGTVLNTGPPGVFRRSLTAFLEAGIVKGYVRLNEL
jgi:cell wall-associated NlpC family hydrolase